MGCICLMVLWGVSLNYHKLYIWISHSGPSGIYDTTTNSVDGVTHRVPRGWLPGHHDGSFWVSGMVLRGAQSKWMYSAWWPRVHEIQTMWGQPCWEQVSEVLWPTNLDFSPHDDPVMKLTESLVTIKRVEIILCAEHDLYNGSWKLGYCDGAIKRLGSRQVPQKKQPWAVTLCVLPVLCISTYPSCPQIYISYM